MTRARNRWPSLGWSLIPPLAAAGLGIVVIASSTLQGLPFLLVLTVLIIRFPVTTPAAALLMCQEFASQSGSGGSISSNLGYQLYYGPSGSAANLSLRQPIVSPALLMIAFAVAVCLLRAMSDPRGEVRPLNIGGRSLLATMIALTGCAAYFGYKATGNILGAMNQEARPFLLLVLGFILGTHLHRSRADWRAAPGTVSSCLVALLALGLVALATGTADLSVTSDFPAFYDAALPAVAGAVLLALVFQGTADNSTRHIIVGLTALSIVVLSLRRNVWVAVAVALALALIVAYGRRRATRRIASTAVPLICLALLVPGILASVGTRAYDTLFVLGNGVDSSTRGHVTDIEIGWLYVKQHPISGIGSRHPPLPGLVVQNATTVYVHNEWLLDWLRFGLPGVALVTLTLVLAAWRSLVVIRFPRSVSVIEMSAAMFILMAPVSFITAPFLSTTNRWPALFGIAAGIVAVQIGQPPPGTRDVKRDDRPHLVRSS